MAGEGLIKVENDPPGVTLYAGISIGASATRQMTGIFLPAAFQPGSQVDVILYLHGFKPRTDLKLTIDGYWNRRRYPDKALREATNDAGRNVILVAPTLGPRSETGRLTGPGGLDSYLDQVMQVLKAHGPWKSTTETPSLGNLILASHSGGGYRMRQLALSSQQSITRLRECWGFDCTYNQGDDTLWSQWARSHPSARLFIYYIARTQTARLSLALARIAPQNVTVAATSTRSHGAVPRTHWRERIENAPFLSPMAVPQAG
jgi:hypothetical protein